MSSANLVSVVYVEETTYGQKPTPLSGVTLETARFTSESLSGTPTTTTSAAIRTDRMSGGQVVTGLEVGGGLDFELAPGTFFDDFFAAGMMNQWTPAESLSTDVTLTPNPSDDQEATLTITGDFSTIDAAVGNLLQLIPATGDPVVVSIKSVTSTTELVVATMRGEEALTGVTMTVAVPAYLDIGTEQISYVIGKSYTDVLHDVGTDVHSQTYTGSLVSAFNISASYGEIVTGSFTTVGNGYDQEVPSFQQQVVAAGGSVTPAGTTNPVNASVDVPLVTSDLSATDFCIEQFTIDLDNGLDPTQCIGKIAPTGYTLGTAAISISTNIYLSDTSYDAFMLAKLTQDPVSLTFTMENIDGGYAFSLPAVQLSFPDPAATGANEQTMIEAAGQAKVGPNGESALRIYKLVGEQ